MILNFQQLVKDYNLDIKGVIQAGSHHWQEKETLLSLGIKDFVLIEPQAHAFAITQERAKDISGTILFNCAVSDEEGEMTMYCDEDNQGQSSSLLQPKEHITRCPWVHFTREEIVQVKKLDNLAFDRSKYNCIVADLQGAELKAFKGAAELLKTIDTIYTEINHVLMYENCCLVGELDDYLGQFGFKRIVTGDDIGGWTDALYQKIRF